MDDLNTPFMRMLISRIRAEDAFGAWENKKDSTLLSEYLVTKEERRAIPIIGDPDPETVDRIHYFYQAIALAIEEKSGQMAVPIMKLSHEGFGRLFVIVGRLVVLSKTLRDVHRFGFEDMAALNRDGCQAVDNAIAIMEKFPEVAAA
ncbi:MAG: NifX-associated nitrogen fixation protein [Zymomonas mobilis]|uniref:Putative nitrogen fixation protein n=1 Tax=Zymomonas mobilis TaxID=542 RepID=A0A542W3L7_ZYMMB|nr:NifX-associated nitrogen fixation protein [Zymomonas mobilis]TQL18109.1 putative nitrogen fixation protein [Zymomonas mobilis]